MTHSYTLARAMQNWGQFNVYGIALFLWCLVRANNTKDFILAGAALAWTAACHYYFLIYSVLIWLAVVAVDLSPYALRFTKKPRGTTGVVRRWLVGLAVTCGLIGLRIAVHPATIQVAGLTVSMQSPENVVFLMWLAIMALAATYVRLEVVARSLTGSFYRERLRHHLWLAGTAGALLSPLFWESFRLIREGGYPKQSILWKTHLAGANLFSLLMPNPLHALWGASVNQWFTARLMNPQEQAASIGWVCLAATVFSQVWKASLRARHWLALAAAATLLAMGTHLHIAQVNLWCPLPFFWLRLLPVVGNVRVPERWMAVGAVAWSVVLALAIVKLAQQRGWSIRKLSVAGVALILLENWPGVPFRSPPPVSLVYERLKELPPGAVLPVPLYIGDSSIGRGNAISGPFIFPWDHLWAQITHQKPMVGGYIGRIPRRLIEAYKADPFTGTLLALEENKISNQSPEPAEGKRAVETFKFRYVLVYPGATDPGALRYVLGSLPLELVESSGPIQLYRVNLALSSSRS